MQVFSIICLVLILFVIQHLLNWFWRKNYTNDNVIILGILTTVASIFISSIIINLIIEWGNL
jgi:hypothetical protein